MSDVTDAMTAVRDVIQHYQSEQTAESKIKSESDVKEVDKIKEVTDEKKHEGKDDDAVMVTANELMAGLNVQAVSLLSAKIESLLPTVSG